jgi:hypothetical protein
LRKLAAMAVVLVLGAQPVLACELKQEDSSVTTTVTYDECKDKEKYDNVAQFTRKGKSIWLRCGKKGKKGWGYRHIYQAHGGWTGVQKYATAKTLKYGKKTKQSEGSYRYKHKVKILDDKIPWVVVVQHTKQWKTEPKPKHIITSFSKD